ncbi:hypothetical protein [Streptantibioticus silvisoli]|uniref:DUF1453 domain-containing protein n=1 Tax=Streptantibioticus silvisoli TaxID=2705255 RepID=A0ABT6W2H4_9ACTN|nr:hypothetical protein [Streptantibioticus silvisoli]MDI5964947.1 hypothetical protein [Streptantibioticus silvisoli]
MNVLEILAIIAIVAYVIGRQLLGEPLRAKRLVVLPAVLAVVGVSDLAKGAHTPGTADVVCLLVSGVLCAGIGFGQGAVTHLETRDGALWGRMPPKGLWLWLALVVSRLLMTLIATGLHAGVASSTKPMLLLLGINRLAQAGVVAFRAMTAGVPFAPEQDRGASRGGRPHRSQARGADMLRPAGGGFPSDGFHRPAFRPEPGRTTAGPDYGGTLPQPPASGPGQEWPTAPSAASWSARPDRVSGDPGAGMLNGAGLKGIVRELGAAFVNSRRR